MILCSEAECVKPPAVAGAMTVFKARLLRQALALKEVLQMQLAELKQSHKSLWKDLTDYLKASASDTWSNVDEMFAEFDKEGHVIPKSDFDDDTKDRCVSFLLLLYVKFMCLPPFYFFLLFTVR